MKKLLSFVALTGCLLHANQLYAQDLTAQETANKAYIFGFLAGLQQSGNEAGKLATEIQPAMQSEFFQRAYTSRLGKEPQRFSSKHEVAVCLPEGGVSEQQLQDMISKLNQISMSPPVDKAQQLFQVVQSTYPCS